MPAETIDLPYYRARIAALAARGVYIGTSSWKYEGWCGQIYDPSRYEYRGRFATTRFEANCLREYAETFRTVCVDAAYYTWPLEKNLRELADQVPDDFRFGFKVTEQTTVKRYPSLPRYGAHAGMLNEHFLNAPLFIERFLGPLSAIRPKVGPVMFEFSRFFPGEYSSGSDFIADLDRFLSALPKDWDYAVELRNRKWLEPEYLACLQRHEVAHVFNNWTHMPSVAEQIPLVGEQRTNRLSAARFLLKPGRDYETAVQTFRPYDHTHEINDEARTALQDLVTRGILKPSKDGSFYYINNRLEGNALLTILAVLDRLMELIQVSKPEPTAPTPAPPVTKTDCE